eukprot:13033619-Alexandrium_andersonii.AAC.1
MSAAGRGQMARQRPCGAFRRPFQHGVRVEEVVCQVRGATSGLLCTCLRKLLHAEVVCRTRASCALADAMSVKSALAKFRGPVDAYSHGNRALLARSGRCQK